MLRFAPAFRGRYIASTRGGVTENIARISVSMLAACAGTVAHEGSATISTSIGVSASGQQTDQQHYGTATVGVVISSTASASVTSTHSGTATASIVITTTAAGETGATHAGVASCQINLSVSASGINTNTTVPDETSNGNNMTLYGDSSFSTDSAVGTRAVTFDGSGDYGVINDPLESTFQSPFSISMWVKPDDGQPSGDSARLLSTWGGTSYTISLIQGETGGINMNFQLGGSARNNGTPTAVFTNGTQSSYTHLVCVVDSSATLTLYVNGNSTSITSSGSGSLSDYSSSQNIAIGTHNPASPTDVTTFTGKIDDISIWNTELTSTQASNIYNSGNGTDLTGSSNLVGYWKMGDSNNLEVTHSGTATVSVDVTASASGNAISTHSGVASVQVNLSASAGASSYDPLTEVPDESGENNVMVLSGNTSFSTTAAIGSKSVDFGGSNGYTEIDDTFQSLIRSSNFSISAWVQFDTTHDTAPILSISDSTSNNNRLQFYRTNGNKLQFTIVSNGSSRSLSTSGATTLTGSSTWFHLVVTVGSNDNNYPDFKAYTDGSFTHGRTDQDLQAIDLSQYTSSLKLEAGRLINQAGSWYLNGRIDDISIWDKELSSTEVSNLYNSGSGTDLSGSSNLVGWWKMGDSNAIAHSGTASCQVNLSASASGSSVTPASFGNTYAISCDGTDDYIDLNSNFSSVFNSDFSIAFWINLPEGQPTGSGHSATSNSNIFGLSNSDNAHRFFGLIGRGGQSDAGKLRIYYKANGNQVQARSASAFFSSGATGWVHVVITVEEASDGIKMYKNGSAVSVDEADSSMSTVTMSNFAGNVDMTFGASNRGGTPNYEVDADFDEIAIFNTALSASQVSTIYNNASVYDLDGHSNLEGWWRFEEGSGTSIADSSSNSNTATLVNGPTFNTNAPIVYANEYSLEFDGTNDHLSTNLVTNTYNLKNGFSASLWVKLDDVSTTQDFFGRYGASTGRFYFGITGSNVRAAIGTSFDTSTLSHGMSTGTWYHVAYTFSGGSSGTFTYYLNGSSVGTISFTWTSDSGSYEPMHIGGLKNGSNLHQNPTNGKLDEFALYNSTLSASDITAIYNSGTPVNQGLDSNLVAYWRMEENTGTTVADSSNNSNTATLTNGPTFNTDVPS